MKWKLTSGSSGEEPRNSSRENKIEAGEGFWGYALKVTPVILHGVVSPELTTGSSSGEEPRGALPLNRGGNLRCRAALHLRSREKENLC